MSSVKISATVITYNEARNIGRCIEALEGLADEIIVLDSGSTDDTVAICAARGITCHVHPFDDYADQKNRAAALASNDLILSVDADEAPSDELRSSIFAVKAKPTASAYTMKRLTQYCGTWVKHSGWYPDTKLRLYDRRKGKWTGRKIHERITMDEGEEVSQLEGDLLHYSFYTIEQHMNTVNKFSSLKAELLHEAGRKANILQLCFSPIVHFLKSFILQAGFLDGRAGFNIAVNSAHGTFLKYAKLRELNKAGSTQVDPK